MKSGCVTTYGCAGVSVCAFHQQLCNVHAELQLQVGCKIVQAELAD